MDFRRLPDYCEQTFDPRTVCSEVNMAILADELLDPHLVATETVRDEDERTDANYLSNTNQSSCSLHSTSFLNELSSPLLLNESSSGNETSTCSSGGQLQSNRPHANSLIYSDLVIGQKEKIYKSLNPVPESTNYLRSYISTDNLQVTKRDNVECEHVARVHENAYSVGSNYCDQQMSLSARRHTPLTKTSFHSTMGLYADSNSETKSQRASNYPTFSSDWNLVSPTSLDHYKNTMHANNATTDNFLSEKKTSMRTEHTGQQSNSLLYLGYSNDAVESQTNFSSPALSSNFVQDIQKSTPKYQRYEPYEYTGLEKFGKVKTGLTKEHLNVCSGFWCACNKSTDKKYLSNCINFGGQSDRWRSTYNFLELDSKHDAKPTVATSGKYEWKGQFDRCCHPQHYHAYRYHHDSHHQHYHQHPSQQQHPLNLHFIYGHPTHDTVHSRSFQSLRQSSRKLRNHLRRGQLQGTYNSSERLNCADSTGASSVTSHEQNEKSRTHCDLDWHTLANVVPPVPPGGGFNWLNSRQPLFCSVCVGSGRSSEAERVSSHIQLSLREMKIWSELYAHGAEMIATNTGRRIFPPLSVNVTGLCPKDQYAFLLDMVLVQPHVFRHQGGQWSIAGQSDEEKTNTAPGTLNICSMRQYIPRFTLLRIIQNQSCYSEAASPSLGAIPDCGYALQAPSGQCSSTGTRIEYIGSYIIPGTQFYTVTAYQNPDVIRIKIDNNPFAKGFRNRQNFNELDGIIMASRIGFPNSPYGQPSNSSN
ncbi:hypothetical protein EG68_02264 [Paragonimus skrjabini miyazakii]|uniref:T-box domain-containing protein n=1 Tax=Paragonimus skrjabini miyazakii TaxID=59628 RepID=A0A8S9Z9A6_9TREM|nr:hypothetical protein EG68_02264 [Paragonimus skrjabini miyazakii]